METSLWQELRNVLQHGERLVVHMAVENAPFSKKGGLGDVVESLPAALTLHGIQNVVLSPYYSNMGGGVEPELVWEDEVLFQSVSYTYRLYALCRNGVYNVFVRLEEAFSFDKLYRDGLLPYSSEVDLSYFMLGKVMFHFVHQFVRSAVLVTHDWHVASVYPYVRAAKDKFTTHHIIHNYHYQGEVFPDIMHYVEAETRVVLRDLYDRYGACSLSAIALEHADSVSTVSPTYAQELQEQRAPHPFLKVAQNKQIRGLLNGMHSHWNPAQDAYLVQPYDADSLALKKRNKKHLIDRLGLSIDEDTPIVLLLSRLTIQKGIDLLIDMKLGPRFDIHERMQKLTDLGVAVIVCGTPQGGIGGPVDGQFQAMADRNTERFAYVNTYTEEIAHQLLAGADLLLHPSRFEPCGLTQMHALAYGTLPIVTPTGGLKDTVTCVLEQPDEGFGFYMQGYSYQALQDVLEAALSCYRDDVRWQELMCRAMAQQNEWPTRIEPYLELFERAFTTQRNRFANAIFRD